MISKKNNDLNPISGNENTEIKQIFNPQNTVNGIRYSLAESVIQKGGKSKVHKMKTSEVYFILEGNGILHVENESVEIERYQSVFVPPFSSQYLENTGNTDLKVLCIVDPAWKKENEIFEWTNYVFILLVDM